MSPHAQLPNCLEWCFGGRWLLLWLLFWLLSSGSRRTRPACLLARSVGCRSDPTRSFSRALSLPSLPLSPITPPLRPPSPFGPIWSARQPSSDLLTPSPCPAVLKKGHDHGKRGRDLLLLDEDPHAFDNVDSGFIAASDDFVFTAQARERRLISTEEALSIERHPHPPLVTFDDFKKEILAKVKIPAFVDQFHSSLLMDTLNAVESAEDMRMMMEIIKKWRRLSGDMNWQLGTKLIGEDELALSTGRPTDRLTSPLSFHRRPTEKALETKTPSFALHALQHPTAFGIHVHSPLRPPFNVPTTIYAPSPKRDHFMLAATLARADNRDARSSRPFENLPREQPYVVLPEPHVMVREEEDLVPLAGETIPEPARLLREFVRVLAIGGPEEGKLRDLNAEEARFLEGLVFAHVPKGDPVVVAALLSTYGALDDKNAAQREIRRLEGRLAQVTELEFPSDLSASESEVIRTVTSLDFPAPIHHRVISLLEGERDVPVLAPTTRELAASSRIPMVPSKGEVLGSARFADLAPSIPGERGLLEDADDEEVAKWHRRGAAIFREKEIWHGLPEGVETPGKRTKQRIVRAERGTMPDQLEQVKARKVAEKGKEVSEEVRGKRVQRGAY